MDKKHIYLDNCITTQPAPEVIEAMLPYLREKFWFPGSFISTGEAINADLERYKEIVAGSLNAKPSEIHFTNGGTLANNIAIKGLLEQHSGKGKHIICSIVDYPDILTNAAFFEEAGFEVTYLSPDQEAFIDLDELKEAIRPDTILFMTTAVNHVVGTIQPLKKIEQILRAADHHIFFHVDACQGYGKIPLDMKELDIDTMSISAHKIHGPQGIGALYLRQGTKIGQYVHGIARFDDLQTGGLNFASIAGFAKAVELQFSDLKGNISRLRDLSNYLLESIQQKIPYVELNGPLGEGRAPHNMNVTFDYIEGEAITMMMDMHGITVATGSACASEGLKANYVLMAIGKTFVQSHGSMKFTVGRYNTREEIDYTVDVIAEIVKELRSRSPLFHENK
ncbi:MAG TPA: cysteine desulfurase family protein [Candidatus Cloacimonadota bacterium]|nr:cysteine desulfurase family protein [Candidatus Cloacimonadota bacterium]HPT72810.1 cysteine desulfurase family protein [Candidatus Cloacimonadota bacterium]